MSGGKVGKVEQVGAIRLLVRRARSLSQRFAGEVRDDFCHGARTQVPGMALHLGLDPEHRFPVMMKRHRHTVHVVLKRRGDSLGIWRDHKAAAKPRLAVDRHGLSGTIRLTMRAIAPAIWPQGSRRAVASPAAMPFSMAS
ncbi:hypothetical protein OKA06_10790 [Novosphingobium sp. MW5]|nr:hypothetical protein [Novosphingobium sp. MW5]